MAIRLRIIDSDKRIALCAADFPPAQGDIYIDDAFHTALSEKFMADFKKMGFIKDGIGE